MTRTEVRSEACWWGLYSKKTGKLVDCKLHSSDLQLGDHSEDEVIALPVIIYVHNAQARLEGVEIGQNRTTRNQDEASTS